MWFVVGIPIYFYAVLSDGTPEGNRATFFLIGSFMAIWTVLYGAVASRRTAFAAQSRSYPRGLAMGRSACGDPPPQPSPSPRWVIRRRG